MHVTQEVKTILDLYEGDNAGVKANLVRILSSGKLAGTGSIIGRNTFQRPRQVAMEMPSKITDIYLGKA